MFPVTDDSATIADCLLRAAAAAGVKLVASMGVRAVEQLGDGFWLTLTDGTNERVREAAPGDGRQPLVGRIHHGGKTRSHDRATGAFALHVSPG
jgi:hypothetical protein